MHSPSSYTVGWICALPLEMRAAIAMLDETHPQLSYPSTDQNAYTLGSIAGHNVVITCLPSGIYGTVSAATVLSQMLFTFPGIQFGMMVGIGGGVPSESNDIRLGDVVVSKPTGTCSGVVQYDYGKAVQGGRFEQTGSLNHPPQLLLTHMSLLQAKMMDQKDGYIFPLIKTLLNQHPQLEDNFGCPGPDEDVLFNTRYPHTGTGSHNTCADCDPEEIVPRSPRSSMEPYVHYGTIASGDQVMKDSEARDRLARELEILCFEMEAAGLMNQLPCLVIRGICDYSDSHKNKQWQGYAALTAAAYSKLLLSTLKPRTLTQINKSARGKMTAEEKACLRALFLSDPEEDKNALKRRKGERAPDTCNWILDTNELQIWLGLHYRQSLGFMKSDADFGSNLLWLYGNPGTGKSTMAITMAEELPKKPYFGSTKALAYFFCDSSSANRRTAVSILRGLLYQLIKGKPELIELLFSKYQERKDSLFTSFDALWSVLLSIGADAASGDKYCIIDAVDECDPESQDMLLAQINQTFLNPSQDSQSRLHILVTSRPYPEIGRYMSRFKNQDLSQYPRLAVDLNLLIKSKVTELSKKNRYSEKVAAEVSMILKDKAEGTFLWVGIACTELASVRSRDATKTLQKMPRGLDSLYRSLLDSAITHGGEDNQTILQMMNVVAISQQPLSVAELSVACNLYPDEDEESRLNFAQEDIELCRLMVIVQNDVVRLLHKSVRDFLLRKGGENPTLIDDLKAHATLAYRCLDTWLDNYQHLSTRERQLSDVVFLEYAAKYWGTHAHQAKSEFQVLTRHNTFFRANSDARDVWAERLEFHLDLPSNPERFSALHMAAFFGIECLVDFSFKEMQRGLVFGRWRKVQACFDDIKFTDGLIPTPLELAARKGQIEVMTLLLEKKVDHMEILANVIEAAAENEEHGGQMVALLLTHTHGEVQIDESVFKAAASNRSHGRAVMSMLLDRDANVSISHEMQKGTAARPTLGGILADLYANRSPRICQPKITEDVIEAAMKNQEHGTAIMTMLVNRLQDKLHLSEEIMENMCAHLEPSIVPVLLGRCGSNVPLTVGLVDAAVRNPFWSNEMLTALFNQCDRDAQTISDQDILDKSSCNASPGLINQLLDRQKEPLILTSLIAQTVGYRAHLKNEVIRILLDRCQIEDWPGVADSICPMFGPDIVSELMDRCELFEITTSMIKAVARENASDVMKTILLHPRTAYPGDSKILLICRYFDTNVMRALLKREVNMRITPNIVASVNENKDQKGVMTTLLECLGEMDMTPNAITMICELFDSEIVELLSTKQNGLIVTAELIKASMLNKNYAQEVMMVLTRQPAHALMDPELIAMLCRLFDAQIIGQLSEVTVSEAVVYAAADNFLHGREILTLLLRRHGRGARLDARATAAVLELFAGDLEIMELLYNCSGALPWLQKSESLRTMPKDKSRNLAVAYMHNDAESVASMLTGVESTQAITDVMELAASNVVDAKNVMLVLLDRYRGQIQLTQDMFEAAAANEYCGSDVMEVLLNWEEDTSLVSEAVMRKAASNLWNGRYLVELLVCRCHEQNFLTDGVLKAALANHESGADIIKLLLYHYPNSTIHITQDHVKIAAATNGSYMLHLLLNHPQSRLQIQQEAVAAICQLFDSHIVSLLFADHGDIVTINDDVIQAAANNCLDGKHILDFLLSQCKPTSRTIEKALEAAAAADEHDVVDFLINRQEVDEDSITEDIICAAAGNIWGTCQVLSLLLRRFESRVQITERVLVAAASNGRDAIPLLIRQRERIPITDAILQAALDNAYHGERILDQLKQYQHGAP
ncbi:hypothetical protein BJX99DRAFT_270950 [Aspergillus californicus]